MRPFPLINNRCLDKTQENDLIKSLKRYKEVAGWTSANDIVSISPNVSMVYMSSEKGSKLYRDPKRKLNASTWKDWNARFDDAFPKEHSCAAQFVEQGSLDAIVDKVVEAEGAAEPTHEPGIETKGGSGTSSSTICHISLYPPLCAGEVISIHPSLLIVVYMCYVCDVCVCFKVFVIVALSALFCIYCGLVGLDACFVALPAFVIVMCC